MIRTPRSLGSPSDIRRKVSVLPSKALPSRSKNITTKKQCQTPPALHHVSECVQRVQTQALCSARPSMLLCFQSLPRAFWEESRDNAPKRPKTQIHTTNRFNRSPKLLLSCSRPNDSLKNSRELQWHSADHPLSQIQALLHSIVHHCGFETHPYIALQNVSHDAVLAQALREAVGDLQARGNQ